MKNKMIILISLIGLIGLISLILYRSSGTKEGITDSVDQTGQLILNTDKSVYSPGDRVFVFRGHAPFAADGP